MNTPCAPLALVATSAENVGEARRRGTCVGRSLIALIDRYLRECVQLHRLRQSTAREQRYVLYHFARSYGRRAPARMGRRDVERWLASISHLAAGTRRTRFSTVRSFLAWAATERIIPRDPTAGIPAPTVPRHVPRALPAGAGEQLLDHCPDTRARAIVALMLDLGLRRAEVAGLEVGDWDRAAKVVTIWAGKGGHGRVLPVPERTARHLAAYLAEHPASAGPLIRSFTDPARPLRPYTIGTLVARWCREAGVKVAAGDGISAHALRHTAASETFDACGDITVVQEMLGHQQINTTRIYLRRAGLGRLRAALEARDTLDSVPPVSQNGPRVGERAS